MKAILIPFLSLLIPLTPQSAFAQSEPELKLESVVIVSRHGVRAPTKATQLMQDVTPDAWPTWPVKLGWLTPRGGELIAYLGHYQRQRLVADGLLAKKGCPQSGQVAIIADVDERTRKTGEAFAAGLAPDCAITVHTQADTSSPDPLFNPLKTGVCQLDNANVTDAILSRAGGSIADFTGHRQTAFRELERVLNFAPGLRDQRVENRISDRLHDFHPFFDYRPGDCQRVDGIGDDDGPPRHHCSAL